MNKEMFAEATELAKYLVEQGEKLARAEDAMMKEVIDIDGVKFHHVDQDRVASLVQEEIVPRANA